VRRSESLLAVGFMHHVRRRIRGTREPTRSKWRRTYTYQVDYIPMRPWLKIRTPISHDAPIGPQDERFWRRLDVVLVGVVVVIALVVFVASHV